MKKLKLFLTLMLAMFVSTVGVHAACDGTNDATKHYSITTDSGEQYCATLSEASTSVKDNGTITLIRNDSITADVTIAEQKTITLDLAGNTIETKDSRVLFRFNQVKLTITDSKTGGNISNTDGNGFILIPAQNGTLTIEKVTIKSAGTSTVIQTGNSTTAGTLIIKSGKVINTNNQGSVNVIANGNTIIDGGELTTAQGYDAHGASVIQLGTAKNCKSTLTVNGGTIEHKGSKAPIFAPFEGTEVIINGGTIKGNSSDPDDPVIMIGNYGVIDEDTYGSGAKVTIIKGNILGGVSLAGKASVGDIKGGEIKGTVSVFGEDAELNISGGNITAKGFAIAGNGSARGTEDASYNSKITISGGNITSETNAAIYHPHIGKLNITGGNITGKLGIVARQGDITIDGGTITANGTGEDVRVGDACIEKNPDGSCKEYAKMPQGVAVIVDNSEDGYEDVAKVTISKGEFNVPEGKEAVLDYKNDEPVKNIQISGGTFNVDVAKVYLASNDLGQSESGVVGKLHKVQINKTENGKVEAYANAAEGEEVIVKITANKGYELDKITILDKDGKEVKFVSAEGGVKFTMPTSDVTISATFKKVATQAEENPKTGDNILMYLGLGLASVAVVGLSVKKLRKSN